MLFARVMFTPHGAKPPIKLPGLVEPGQGRGFAYLRYSDAEPHVTLGVTLPSRRISGGRYLVGQNSGRERNSLIRAGISLFADLNSLQGWQKIPCSGAQGNRLVKY
jgi:hypothetical protein